MASRTSTGVGMAVAVTLLGIAMLAFFVLSIYFYSEFQKASTRLVDLEAEYKDFVADGERQLDDVARVRDKAKENRQSVVRYLMDGMETTTGRAVGIETVNVDQFISSLDGVAGTEGADLKQLLTVARRQISDLESRLRQAQQDLTLARQQQQADSERVAQIASEFSSTTDSIRGRAEEQADDVARYREELNDARGEMNDAVSRARDEARDREFELNTRIDRLQSQLLASEDRVRELQDQLRGQRYGPADEGSLIDGEVIALESTGGAAYINRGQRDKIVVGLRFEVYSQGTTLEPDPETGALPPSKATLEVIRVDPTTSLARIIRESRGSPLVKSDVIVNPVYDPDKTYKFLVYGNFDTNRDGRATPQEATDVEARLRASGGLTVSEFLPDLDFVVLGERPILPPQPPATAPPAVIDQWVRVQTAIRRYEELLDNATRRSVPVLNLNRLTTLLDERR